MVRQGAEAPSGSFALVFGYSLTSMLLLANSDDLFDPYYLTFQFFDHVFELLPVRFVE